MNRFVFPLFFLVSMTAFAQESIEGTWYRNDLFAGATLTVGKDLHFEIDAQNTAHTGEIDGSLEKISDGIYFTKIEDYGEKCVIVFQLDGEDLKVILYGDQVGAGFTVYFGGTYERHEFTDEESRQQALAYILSGAYDSAAVERLLGKDIDLFILSFEAVGSTATHDPFLENAYEGFLPGAALDDFGIFAVGGKYIYILFQDERGSTTVYQYYTNDPARSALPATFASWLSGHDDHPIVKHLPG